MSIAIVLALAVLATVGLAVLWRLVSRPYTALDLLALGVSLVAVNVHVGVTLYLSRLAMMGFLLALLIRRVLQLRGGPRLRCDGRLVVLFAATLTVQVISAWLSDRTADSLRQMFIYFSAMMVFVTVLSLADSADKIIRALRLYLAAGVLQGLYGLYQVAGGPRGWPTYQTLTAFIPTANDRTSDGYYFTPGYDVFRAVGFFPADVSHYAGYLAGVLLIALGFLTYRRRDLLAHTVLATCGAGLLFSLSRSGIVAFAGIGLPAFVFALWLSRILTTRRIIRFTARAAFGLAVVFVAAAVLSTTGLWARTGLPDVLTVLVLRLSDLLQVGSSQFESMALHIETRMLALDAFLSSPIIGVGLGVTATPWYSVRYQEPWYGAHSHHFNILGETGLLGALLEWTFMALVLLQLLRGLRSARRRSREQAVLASLLAAYITIVLGNFFYSYYTNDYVWFVMGCGWALSREARREARDRRRAAATLSGGAPVPATAAA